MDIDALIEQREIILEAFNQGARDAMKRHIQAGVPMIGCKDGQTIRIMPEELAEMLKAAEAEAAGRPSARRPFKSAPHSPFP